MMLALVLFAAGTVAVMDFLHRAEAGTTDGENTFIAMRLGQRCQEALRNTAYANLSTQASTTCTIPSGAAFSRFSRTVTTTPQTSTVPYNTARLTQLDVQISWSAPGGTSNVTLSTLRSVD
jgi:hypothetical protein